MIRTKSWKWLLWVLWILQYLVEAVCLIRICELNILPMGQYFAMVAVMFVMLLAVGKLMFLRKGYVKSGKNALMCAFGCALAILTILICGGGTWYASLAVGGIC